MKPCIYCGAPWHAESIPINHHARCPFVTNLWPVGAQDFADDGGGFGCTGCGHQFAIGEFYTLRPLGAYDAVVCLGCDVLNVELESSE